MQDDFFDPIYKGCTAPSTLLGVPLIPCLIGALTIGQLTVLSFYFIGLSLAVVFMVIGGFVFAWARRVSANDEHRLLQYLLLVRIRGRQASSRRVWGAVSFSPFPRRSS